MEGEQIIEVTRGGVPQLCGMGSILINNTIQKYNFNAVVGQATTGGCTEIVPSWEEQVVIHKSMLL